MKALRFEKTGDLDHLHLADVPVPEPGEHEVLVEVRAAGLNPSDIKNVLGNFPYTTLPRTPGRDFAGVVVMGPENWQGRAVWGTGKEVSFSRDGSHADYICVPVSGITAMPESLSFARAATCGVPYITAMDGLERTQADADDRLVVTGGNGAVGRAVINLAHSRGIHTLAVTRREEESERLASEGIDAITMDDPATLPERVEHHFGKPATLVFETTGHLLAPCVRLLAPYGHLLVIAAPPGGNVEVPVLDLYRRGGSIIGINSLLYDLDASARLLEQLTLAFDKGELAPPPEPQAVPLEEAVHAYRALQEGRSVKTVLVPEQSDF